MPSLFVTKRGDVDDDANTTIDGMPELMIAQCILALITLLLNYLFLVDGKELCTITMPDIFLICHIVITLLL